MVIFQKRSFFKESFVNRKLQNTIVLIASVIQKLSRKLSTLAHKLIENGLKLVVHAPFFCKNKILKSIFSKTCKYNKFQSF